MRVAEAVENLLQRESVHLQQAHAWRPGAPSLVSCSEGAGPGKIAIRLCAFGRYHAPTDSKRSLVKCV